MGAAAGTTAEPYVENVSRVLHRLAAFRSRCATIGYSRKRMPRWLVPYPGYRRWFEQLLLVRTLKALDVPFEVRAGSGGRRDVTVTNVPRLRNKLRRLGARRLRGLIEQEYWALSRELAAKAVASRVAKKHAGAGAEAS